MEELLAFALLHSVGFDIETDYRNKLDELFLETPEDDTLLELESMSSKTKESMDYIRLHFDYDQFDRYTFGKFLMETLKKHYSNTEIHLFARRMYLLWQRLPDNIQNEEPFHTMSYAGDSLTWGDEKQTRNHLEYMLNEYT